MASVIDNAVSWAISIANNESYGYVWGGWGESDGGYDCGHFVITAYEQAGIKVKTAGATYTGDMKQAFLSCGFKDVTDQINLNTGSGLKKGDVLLNIAHHAALVQADGGTLVEARGSSYGIICNEPYRVYSAGWDCVLRLSGVVSEKSVLQPMREETIDVPEGLGKYYTYMNWNFITNMDTQQGKLIKTAGKNYDSEGYGKVGERYTLAMTSTFGNVGDYVDVYMADGRIIHGIIADMKNQNDSGCNKWGHDSGQNIVEFVTNWSSHDNPKSNGAVLKVINLGSYFDYPEYAAGNVENYYYSENAYTDETASAENQKPTVVWHDRKAENIHRAMNNLALLHGTGELQILIGGVDTTNITGDLQWQNSTDELATTMSFSMAKSDAKYISNLMYNAKTADIVQLVTNEEIFRGVILRVEDGDEFINHYTAVDLGWYLNKVKQTYQFDNITASEALTELFEDLSIPVVMLPELDTVIDSIYFDKSISEIIDDILSQCSGDFNYDFTPAGIRIYRIGDIAANPILSVAANVREASSVEYRGNVSHSYSMEELKNSVKVTSVKDNVYTELLVKQDRGLIEKYGFLQEIIQIDPENENAETVAEQYFSEMGHETETFSFEIVEKLQSYTRAGSVIDVKGIRYTVKSTQHSVVDGIHYNRLELKKRA